MVHLETRVNVALWLLVAALAMTSAPIAAAAESAAAGGRSVTQGRAKTVIDNIYQCPVKVGDHRVSAAGTTTATDGTVGTAPAETVFQSTKVKGADLYNECTQVTPKAAAEVSDKNVPIVEVDKDGEVITGYIVADNYFELYVNGKLVAVDAIPFTPFNSTIVKFRAKRPITYAILGVDWEENLGLGTELNQGQKNPWHPGDGGVIARFSDGTVTDSSWKAQSFYIAPLMSPDEVIERGNIHDTTKLGRVHPVARKPPCEDKCYAVRYPIPKNWTSPSFDDSRWPRAYEYTDEDIGVTGVPGYTRFPELFDGARWIWSINLVLDNVVIARKTVR